MSIETIQACIGSIIQLFPAVSPIFLLSALICFAERRTSWVVPLWVFTVCPVFVLLYLLVIMISRTGGIGPDEGFVAMGTAFTLMFSLVEVIPGIILICACPPIASWSRNSLFAAIPAAALSFLGMFALFHFATVPPQGPDSAASFVETYLTSTNGGDSPGFRARAFCALLANPNTPPNALVKASELLHKNSSLWYYLEKNPSLPRSVMEAKINDPNIGIGLMRNPGFPGELFKTLAESPDREVRYAVAQYKGTPLDILIKLAHDKDEQVANCAFANVRYDYPQSLPLAIRHNSPPDNQPK